MPNGKTETKLPLRAELLLKILLRYQGKNEYAWPRQELLAEEMGISVRMVQMHIATLIEAGLIEAERPNRMKTNRYYIPPRIAPPDTKKIAPPDTKKIAPPDTKKIAPPDTKKIAPPDTKKIAPPDTKKIAPHTLVEFGFIERGIIEGENAPPPLVENSKYEMPDALEHPKVEEVLQSLRAFDAMPDEWRQRIEAEVRLDSPLSNSTDQEFRMACAALAKSRPFFLRFLEFKTVFVKEAPGMPRDPAKWDFFDKLERKLERLDPTLEEMLRALERLDESPRRNKDNKDPRNFAREAYRFLPGYIQSERSYAAQQRRCAAPQEELRSSAAETPAVEQPVLAFATEPDCVRVGESLIGKIGEARFALWFANKTELKRHEGGFVLSVPNTFVRDWVRSKFCVELNEAAGANVRIEVRPDLFATKERV